MRSSRRNLGLQPEVTPEESESEDNIDSDADAESEEARGSVEREEANSLEENASKLSSDVNLDDSDKSETSSESEVISIPSKSK